MWKRLFYSMYNTRTHAHAHVPVRICVNIHVNLAVEVPIHIPLPVHLHVDTRISMRMHMHMHMHTWWLATRFEDTRLLGKLAIPVCKLLLRQLVVYTVIIVERFLGMSVYTPAWSELNKNDKPLTINCDIVLASVAEVYKKQNILLLQNISFYTFML